MVTREFIRSFYARCASRKEDRDERAEQVHSSLLAQSKSLFSLLERGPTEAADELTRLAEGLFSAYLRGLAVLETLRERFPEATLRDVLLQAVKELKQLMDKGQFVPRPKD